MALTGRGDSTRVAEGLIPLVATTTVRRRLAGEAVVANWLGLSRNVGIVHVLRASTVPGDMANARERGSPTVRSSVEREFVRFIALNVRHASGEKSRSRAGASRRPNAHRGPRVARLTVYVTDPSGGCRRSSIDAT